MFHLLFSKSREGQLYECKLSDISTFTVKFVCYRFVSEAVEGGIEFNPENIVSVVVNNPNTPRAVTRVVTRAHRSDFTIFPFIR